MVETAILAAASTAQAAGTSAALATAGGVATAAQVGATTGGMFASGLTSLAAGSSLLSGALTAASAFGQIQAGRAASAESKFTARQYELSARAEELKGREQADKIRRSLQATLAAQNAAFSARGIALGSGTPVALGNVSKTEASRDIENAQFGANVSAAADRGNAAQSRINARTLAMKGYTSAAGTLYAGRNTLPSLVS